MELVELDHEVWVLPESVVAIEHRKNSLTGQMTDGSVLHLRSGQSVAVSLDVETTLSRLMGHLSP